MSHTDGVAYRVLGTLDEHGPAWLVTWDDGRKAANVRQSRDGQWIVDTAQ